MQDPILKYLKGNYWKGEPERHSEAAKIGWELRHYGWLKGAPPSSWGRDDKKHKWYHKKKGTDYILLSNTDKGWMVSIDNSKKQMYKGYGPFKTELDAKKAILPRIMFD